MRKLTILCSLLLSVIILSGCSQPTPKQSDMSAYNMYNNQEGTTKQQLKDTSNSGQQAQENTQNAAQNQGRNQMSQKTLADFEKIEAQQVTITTNKGDIVFEIYTDKVPLTAANFLNLAKQGYYDGVVFHRVIDNFMIQTGDPLSKDPTKKAMWGTGGPGYTIADEFSPDLKHDGPGIVSMANAGANTGGSQFFITHTATEWLDGKHAVFGKVIEGMEVVNSIKQGDTIISVSFK